MSNEESIEKFKTGILRMGQIEEIPGGGWDVRIRGVLIEAKTAEDLFIVYEVFYRGIYNYLFKDNAYVIDIGMNIGIASLFFAANNEVQKVYGYEPFRPTYERAIANFNRNPIISSKIAPHNYGLLDANKHLKADYSEEIKGSIGIHGIDKTGTAFRENPTTMLETREEPIVLKKASEELSPIIQAAKEKNIELFMKIDCEGSEYEILEDLERESLLKDIDVLVMEWHLKGPKDIESALARSNFRIFSVLPYHETTGIILAVNRGS